LSGLPPSEIREKARKVLESMRGIYAIWSLDITEVRRKDSNFVIVGKFSEGLFAGPQRPFAITIDKDGNVIEAKIES
jgi:hypothetical protein